MITVLYYTLIHIDNVRVTNSRIYKALFTLATTVAEFGDRPFSATVPEFGDCCRKRRSDDYRLQYGQGLRTFLAVNAKYRQ